MNTFGGNSNFPPGHPTGVSEGSTGEVYYCEPCGTVFLGTRCFKCHHDVHTRAQCERCSEPATRIDVDNSVDVPLTFCAAHTWRSRETQNAN